MDGLEAIALRDLLKTHGMNPDDCAANQRFRAVRVRNVRSSEELLDRIQHSFPQPIRWAHDHLGDIFAMLDAGTFQRCFVAWVAAVMGAPAEAIVIDGKVLHRSYQEERRPRADPHGVGLRSTSVPGAWVSQGGGQVE